MPQKIKDRIVFSDDELIQQGICPHCWNDLAYYNEYMSYVKDRTKADIHGPSDHTKAFIEEFVQDNITGIVLKNDNNQNFCPRCHQDFFESAVDKETDE